MNHDSLIKEYVNYLEHTPHQQISATLSVILEEYQVAQTRGRRQIDAHARIALIDLLDPAAAPTYTDLLMKLRDQPYQVSKFASLTAQERLGFLLTLIPALKAHYQRLEISPEVFLATLSDVFLRGNIHYLDQGQFGLPADDFAWLLQIFFLAIFKLGELQFERTHFDPTTLPEDIHFYDRPLTTGQAVISVHIMEDSYLDSASIEDAFQQAQSLFKNDFPIADYYCYSWLLYPGLAKVLDSHSKILNFQSYFTIIGDSPWPDMAYQRILGVDSAQDFHGPARTRLQEAALHQPQAMGVGVGIIPRQKFQK